MFSSLNDIDMHTLYAPVLHKPVVGKALRSAVRGQRLYFAKGWRVWCERRV